MKMITIGMIEDEKEHLELLKETLMQWQEQEGIPLELSPVLYGKASLPGELLSCNLLFMDIDLGGKNGVELAKTFRSEGFRGQLVFLTAYEEYVFDGYHVQALDYLLKPVTLEDLTHCMNHMKLLMSSENYIYRYKNVIRKIPYRDIQTITARRHYIDICTEDEIFQQLSKISEVQKYLPEQFIMCHRTTIVNMLHVNALDGHEIIMFNGERIPIARQYLEEARQGFLSFC